MIKIYGNTYYMTCGEACYIARNDGALKHVCFGKRIEPEDDASLLGGAAACGFDEVDSGDISICRGDKRITPHFTVCGAEVADKRGIGVLPILRGDETLKVSTVDEKNGLELSLYYTPYVRGGVARRAELKNVSDKPIKIRRLMSGAAVGNGEVTELFGGLTAVETRAGVYGIFTLYAGETETAAKNGRISSGAKIDVTLGAGETFYTPETLAVYSDNGVGGIVRAYHDIIREFGVPQARLEKRRAIVVYCPTDGGADIMEKRITAAAATGADTVAVDAACGVDKALKYADKTKAHGMRFGLKSEFSKSGALSELVETCGAEYVELDCDGLETYEQVSAAFALYSELKNKYSNIEIDFGHKKSDGSAEQRLKCVAYSPVPLCAVRNVVDGESLPLKTAFDVASFGALGYKLDPAKSGEGALRAIRAQILSYQDEATTVNLGDVYDIGGGIMVVSRDKSKAFAATAGETKLDGLDVHNLYHVRELGKTFSGAALGFYGIKENGDGTVTYHIRQVADYE